MSFASALGGMVNLPQWFLWRLEWKGEEGKYGKTPCFPDGSHYRMDAGKPANWMGFADAIARRDMLCAARGDDRSVWYALGFWLTADSGYFFFDLDNAYSDPVGPDAVRAPRPLAGQLLNYFAGAFWEVSSSGKGLHIIGQYPVDEPSHRTRPSRELAAQIAPLALEFYHEDRGIAFGLNDAAWGCADWQDDGRVKGLIETYFPPMPELASGAGRNPAWRGPDDDDELIRRMLGARQSAQAAFGGKPSLVQLWNGEAEKNSNNDMALAAHLAWWTGNDAERIERLMRRSGMQREKWNEHRTYLSELTIPRACAGCEGCYVEPERSVAARDALYGVVAGPESYTPDSEGGGGAVVVVAASQFEAVEAFLERIAECPDPLTLHNAIIPAIQQAGIAPAIGERLVSAINKRLGFWDSKLPVGKLRSLLFPPAVARPGNAPEWAMKHCYVQEIDKFYDVEIGVDKTMMSFNIEYAGNMPMKDNGQRENPAEWAIQRWGIRSVHRIGYRPDQEMYFSWGGLDYVNTYNPRTVPEATPLTEAGVAAIGEVQALIWDMCGRRQAVFNALMSWLAHNVQHPGTKIMWAPLIKGVQGDGKSILGVMMRSVMGSRNVSVTGPDTLTNSGGFTDWAVRAALNVIEEIHLTGKEAHRLYNAMKQYITNPTVNINPKGTKTYDVFNVTNHMALSNYNSAVPLDPTDRRFMVIFTPWESLAAMQTYCGVDMTDRFRAIDTAIKTLSGELRTWLLGWPIDYAVIRDVSPETPEKRRMKATSRNELDVIAENVIEVGAYGIGKLVLSSGELSSVLKHKSIVENFDLPQGQTLHHMLTRLGYSQHEKVIWWDGKTRRIWVKDGLELSHEQIIANLDGTVRNCKGTVRP